MCTHPSLCLVDLPWLCIVNPLKTEMLLVYGCALRVWLNFCTRLCCPFRCAQFRLLMKVLSWWLQLHIWMPSLVFIGMSIDVHDCRNKIIYILLVKLWITWLYNNCLYIPGINTERRAPWDFPPGLLPPPLTFTSIVNDCYCITVTVIHA